MNLLRRIRIKNGQYINEKLRFLLFVFALFLVLFLARYLFGMAYARYENRTKINANIDRALYIFGSDSLSFNLEPDRILPSADPYSYDFSVSNFNASKQSDVDITYRIKIRTTTNLPLNVKLYRNESHMAAGAVNILGSATSVQDEDDTWYYLYTTSSYYNMNYSSSVTDTYDLVIEYPDTNSEHPIYANCIEHIQVIIESQQIV